MNESTSHSLSDLEEEEPWTLLTEGSQQAMVEASLVLSSQYLWHRLDRIENKYQIFVPSSGFQHAHAVLNTYKLENHEWNLPPPALGKSEGIIPKTLAILFIPWLMYLLQLSQMGADWEMVALGKMNAELFFRGEIWRAITALTLHADFSHFSGNILGGFFLIYILLERFSFGWVLWGGTFCAIVANTVTAFVLKNHFSLGFSTWVFSALGWVMVSAFWEKKVGKNLVQNYLQPLFGGILLFSLMGLAENADVWAHFFGFICGALWGVLFEKIFRQYSSHIVSWVLGISTYVIFSLAWLAALTFD